MPLGLCAREGGTPRMNRKPGDLLHAVVLLGVGVCPELRFSVVATGGVVPAFQGGSGVVVDLE